MPRLTLVTCVPGFDDDLAAACRSDAQTLANSGWTVDLVCGAPTLDLHEADRWRAFSGTGISVLTLADLPRPGWPVDGMRAHVLRSWYLMYALQHHSTDLILFQDRGADGFWTVRAKRLGSGFHRVALGIVARGPTAWLNQQRRIFGADVIDEADLSWCEQEALADADLIVCREPEVLWWMARHKYRTPPRVEQPDLAAFAASLRRNPGPTQDLEIPPISVCIAFYRHDAYLPRLVRAFLDSAPPSLQLVIVDDGTPPDERPQLDRMQAELEAGGHILVRQANAGPGPARNVAARLATHEHLLFFDADDIPFGSLIPDLWRAMARTGADSIGAGYTFIPPMERPPRPDDIVRALIPPGGSVVSGLFDNVISGTTALIRRKTLETLGGFSDDVPHPGCEDWRFFLRLSGSGLRHYSYPMPLFYYTDHPGRYSNVDDAHRYAIRTGVFSELESMNREKLVDVARTLAAHALVLRGRGAW